jgi:hypothetical protein
MGIGGVLIVGERCSWARTGPALAARRHRPCADRSNDAPIDATPQALPDTEKPTSCVPSSAHRTWTLFFEGKRYPA